MNTTTTDCLKTFSERCHETSGSLEGYFLLSWTAALEEGPKNDSAAGPRAASRCGWERAGPPPVWPQGRKTWSVSRWPTQPLTGELKPVIPRARQPRARGQRGRNTGHRRWQQGSSQCGGTQFTPRVPAGPLSSAPRLAGGPCPRGQPSSLAKTGDAPLLRPPGVCPAPKPRTALFLPLRPLRTSHQEAFLEPAPTRTLVPGPPGRGPPCQGRTVKAGLESDTSPPQVAELQEQIRHGGALAGADKGLDTPSRNELLRLRGDSGSHVSSSLGSPATSPGFTPFSRGL